MDKDEKALMNSGCGENISPSLLSQKNKRFGNIIGAFSDGAILFPLLVALTLQTGMNGTILLATAGLAYIGAGFVFRVPMAVQPLKSVVIAALAVGATAAEIQISGLAVGLVCLLLSFCYADKLAKLVPRHLVHGLQLALGIILMMKGMKWGLGDFQNDFYISAGFVVLTLVIMVWSLWSDKPVMGWVAAAGLVLALFLVFGDNPISVQAPENQSLRFDIILALVLPQLALTLTNSVVATNDVAHRYFGAAAKRVTPKRLLRSIGLGNVFSAAVGGLPFCHGSGGLTAHVKGGARSWHMNLMIGGVLLILAGFSWLVAVPLIPAYPQILMAALIFVTGWFHLQLAGPSWAQPELRWILVLMALTALLTQNMLWVLTTGVMAQCIQYVVLRKKMGLKTFL